VSAPAVYVGERIGYSVGDEERRIEDAAVDGAIFSELSALMDAGFRRHWTCRSGTGALDLARKAVQDLGAERLEGVGAIVYATCLPLNGNAGDPTAFARTRDVKHLMDFPGSRLQAELGLDGAIVIGLNQQACTAMLGSLRFARNLLLAEPEIGKVLCVTADRFPEGATYEQAYNLISDGGAACLVSFEPEGFRILACHQVTNGAMAQASDDETVGSYFSYAHRVIRETLAKAALTMQDIAWVVPQNTSDKAWQILAKIFKLDFDRVTFGSLAEVGHVISADNMINLRKLAESGKLRSGDKLLLFMAGFGLNWQCVILERV
jgi:3-oxoacyl-[acyl-carrier-protein] synthase-3